MSITDIEKGKKILKTPPKGANKRKYPPFPKDGEDIPEKLPEGADIPSPDNPWVKIQAREETGKREARVKEKKEQEISIEQVAENYFTFNEIGGITLTDDPEHAVTGADFNAGGPRRKTYPGNIPVKRGRPPKKIE